MGLDEDAASKRLSHAEVVEDLQYEELLAEEFVASGYSTICKLRVRMALQPSSSAGLRTAIQSHKEDGKVDCRVIQCMSQYGAEDVAVWADLVALEQYYEWFPTTCRHSCYSCVGAQVQAYKGGRERLPC